MKCNLCTRTLRWDERLAQATFSVEVSPGVSEIQNAWGCPDCIAKVHGLEAPAPNRYPPGCRMPRHPGQANSATPGDLPICGLCRVALPWGQQRGDHVRLPAEVLDESDLAAGITPGDAYELCGECLARYKPRVVARLKRLCRVCGELDCQEADHVPCVPPGAADATIGGDALL